MNGIEDDSVLTVGEALPEIAMVAPGLGRFELLVTWMAGGPDTVVDLAPDIFTFKAYASLREDAELFKSVRVVNEGSAIAWGPDDGIGMPATAVERLADEIWTEGDFRSFLEDTGLTRDAAAAQLGISRRLIGYYAKGRSIPRFIALACQELRRRLASETTAAATTIGT